MAENITTMHWLAEQGMSKMYLYPGPSSSGVPQVYRAAWLLIAI